MPFAAERHLGLIRRMSIKEALAEAKKKNNAGTGSRYDTLQEPCSKEQARYLRQFWREIWQADPFERGKPKKPGQKRKRRNITLYWLQKNYTKGAAGWLIKQHRRYFGHHKRSTWEIKMPVRHVLGIIPANKEELTNFIYQRLKHYINQALKYKTG